MACLIINDKSSGAFDIKHIYFDENDMDSIKELFITLTKRLQKETIKIKPKKLEILNLSEAK